MRRNMFVCAFALAHLFAFALTSAAQEVQPGVAAIAVLVVPLPDRLANADVIVVGKVTEIEAKTVSALPFPQAKEKSEYKVAVVEIQNGILGAKDMKKVRIGFIPPPPAVPPQPGQPVRPIRRFPQLDFTAGQEGLYILRKHSDADFYEAGAYQNVVDKKSATFEKDVELAKKCARLLADPDAGLKAKDAEERLLTAGLLITRYRGGQFIAADDKKTKYEPIDAAQSKLILEALAGADWKQPKAFGQASPQMYFVRLGLTDKDGWKQPQNGQDFAAVAQKWCQDNAATYRIQRLVPERAEK